MDDLISRQAAIDALMAWEEGSIWDDECLKHRGEPFWVAPSDVIERLPSAQVEITEYDVKEFCRKRCLIVVTSDFYNEMKRRWTSAQPKRKTVEWIKLCGGKVGQCSNCKKEYDRTFEYVDGWMYCPSCGADMTWKEKE